MRKLFSILILSITCFYFLNQTTEAYYQNNGSCDYNQLQYYQAQYDKALNDYQAAINSDPRLQNQGYYLDPSAIGKSASANVAAAAFNGEPIQFTTPQQLAQMQYEAQIANQYGVPYQEYMNAQRQRIANELEMHKQMMNNYQALINQCIRNMQH